MAASADLEPVTSSAQPLYIYLLLEWSLDIFITLVAIVICRSGLRLITYAPMGSGGQVSHIFPLLITCIKKKKGGVNTM